MGLGNNLLVAMGFKQNSAMQTVEASTEQQIQQKKILIVEDDMMLSSALELKFKHENFTVLKAVNGQEGLAMIQANKPNIVLLDLMMPVMDGKTMLHRLREIEEFKFLPVVVL